MIDTDGNTRAIDRYLDEREDYDAMQDMQERLDAALTDAAEAEAYAEELEADLRTVERIIVKRIKFHQELKNAASSGAGRQREHHRVHALSEVLGEIRRETKKAKK